MPPVSQLMVVVTSLNSHLLPGPKLQTDIFDVLLRWRQYQYVYTADIAKMYRQILIDPRDRDYQRILWKAESETTPQEYRLQTVTYGIASAPYLALRVIQQLLHDEGEAYPLALSILRDHIYVDDVLFGAEDIPLLRHTRDQVCSLLQRGGFNLRKWASHYLALLADIPTDDHGLACTKDLKHESLSVFGIRWVTLITIIAKIFMQQLWRLKLEWDDDIPKNILAQWETIYRKFASLDGLQLVRWVHRGSDIKHFEIHGFADASSVAYAAAVYIRVTSLSGEITTTLLAGKSKVAPIKIMSIPRLELSAAVLLARLIESVQNALKLTDLVCHCWTDSTVVLAWLSQHPSKWKTFVSHRVTVVQSKVPKAKWHHVLSEDNPADCASRGLLKQDFASFSLWWQGPHWLKLTPSDWPAASFPQFE
ncbi:uncharacterized protein LOC105203894 [Solenopsis invicta]|uniref:uncharacterized protein LOC105203894 n=1 Tax=Solenopsis invicta TaxID=13686 RepID=UPI000595D89B|nr:uncharacterized protein LOC105203894 [Solenopsis invicta]